MPNVSNKWNKKKPYIYIDYKYPRRMVLYWNKNKLINTTYARWLYESKIGKIPESMTIHHINGIKLDDRIENYKLLTHSQHTTYHNKNRKLKCSIIKKIN